MYEKLVTCVRLLFGVQLVINGLNWWVKIITPYPSMADFLGKPVRAEIVSVLVDTNLFHVVKASELIVGVCMLANVSVPLMLVVAFPVSLPIFMIDVFVSGRLRGMIMGSSALTANVFLLLAYFSHYRSMLVLKVKPDPL